MDYTYLGVFVLGEWGDHILVFIVRELGERDYEKGSVFALM